MKSTYLKNALLNLVLGTGTFTKLNYVYAAVFTTNPNETYASGVEPSTGDWSNYARLAVPNDYVTHWNSATTGVKTNIVNFNFCTSATIVGTAPTIVGVGLFDQVSNGNLLYWGTLQANILVSNGKAIIFYPGNFTIQES